jgi:hypothetical protein
VSFDCLLHPRTVGSTIDGNLSVMTLLLVRDVVVVVDLMYVTGVWLRTEVNKDIAVEVLTAYRYTSGERIEDTLRFFNV